MTTAARPLLALAALAATALMLALPTGAGAAASCEARATSQPFAAWGDTKRYYLVPGGDFERPPAWTLAGGAKVVAGNEPFLVTSAADAHSLLLPAGASARTPSFCVDRDEPTMRFFVRNTGSALATLAVEARISTTVLGKTVRTTLPVGVVLGTAQAWQPSLPVFFKLSANQLLGGTTSVDFRFVPVGGAWQIDDVYVDPFKDR
jgi:hypothetical protein